MKTNRRILWGLVACVAAGLSAQPLDATARPARKIESVKVSKRFAKPPAAKLSPHWNPRPIRVAASRGTERRTEIRSLRFTGNTAISDEMLQAASVGMLGLAIGKTDLQQLTFQIGQIYRQQGMTAHAYIRPESHAGGHLEIMVVEARTTTTGAAKTAHIPAATIPASHAYDVPIARLKMELNLRVSDAAPSDIATVDRMAAAKDASYALYGNAAAVAWMPPFR